MSEPLAFLNGQFLPASQLVVPVWDAGFVQGVTVAEQLRTFSGHLFRLDRHLDRLANSLSVIGVELPEFSRLAGIAAELVAHNHPLLAAGDDLGLSIFVTPGPYAAFAPPEAHGPTIGMHTYPVAFGGFAAKYQHGERLVTTSIEQVPTTCWPAALKCRSRMHYYLADRQARLREPGARALMLDHDQFVTEASTANLVLFRREVGFLIPPREKILPGVSVATLEELCPDLGVPFVTQDITVKDVMEADEAYLSSTSPCLLPVRSLNGIPIGRRVHGDSSEDEAFIPGPVFQAAIAAWSRLVGLDIVAQAQRFARR